MTLIKIVIGAGVLMVLVAIVGIVWSTLPGSQSTTSAIVQPPAIGRPLVDFAVSDLQGQTVHLSDYSGRMVLVNFWATWCPPCRREMPDLNAFYRKYRDSGFIILAVNTGESLEQAAAFADELGLEFPILLDPQEFLSESLLINDFPTSILVGPDGKVKAIHIGLFTADALEAEIGVFLQSVQ